MTTTPTATETLLYTCQVHSHDGRMRDTLAMVSDPCASTYEVQHPDRLHWLVVPSSQVVLGRRLDITQPTDDAPPWQGWEYHAADGWTYHPAPAAMPTTPAQRLQAAMAAAIAAHPAEEARITRAAHLVLEDGVTLLRSVDRETGRESLVAIVSSQSHPGETYRVTDRCTCRDAAHAPEGRCKHRWAKALAKRSR